MFQTIVKAFKIPEVRNKILITIALLFVYRLGCYIPVPGVSVFEEMENFTFLQITVFYFFIRLSTSRTNFPFIF